MRKRTLLVNERQLELLSLAVEVFRNENSRAMMNLYRAMATQPKATADTIKPEYTRTIEVNEELRKLEKQIKYQRSFYETSKKRRKN